MIFEAPRYLSFLGSLTNAEAIRLMVFVNSIYLDPTADHEHIFDFSAEGTPEFRYAFDGEFRLDFLVVADATLVLLDATRAQRI